MVTNYAIPRHTICDIIRNVNLKKLLKMSFCAKLVLPCQFPKISTYIPAMDTSSPLQGGDPLLAAWRLRVALIGRIEVALPRTCLSAVGVMTGSLDGTTMPS
ncbi:hypothetical protein PanWU01x14_083000 [Parasponia andersonii]|uniref:Uncharacterized protein n=1 Tax=Parasponia andersonii TaxID=3476 RepID=A0A2P5DA00_PARAD|nr:hypothetical protein PanWU01x14_083000 [Parasponia andersonii]